MSKSLYLKVTFYEDKNLEEVSKDCFKMVGEASKKNIALYRIRMRAYNYDFLKRNEMYVEISDSYVFHMAEKFLLDDYSIAEPSHIQRLLSLQIFFEKILALSTVYKVEVFMSTDIYEEEDFELVECNCENFAEVMKEKLFQIFTYAFKCEFFSHN